MGLGISIFGEVRSRGLFRGTPSPDKFWRRMTDVITRAVPDPLQHRFLRFEATESGMEITLHPAGEPVYLAFEDDSTISLSAKTSTVGPGYHAMLVELIEAIGAAGIVDWDWTDHGDGEGDETGFFETQNFALLQETMADFLGDLSAAVLGVDADDGLAIFMPYGFRLKTDRFAYSPLGFRDRIWFERAAEAEDTERMALAADFFPWWNHAADAGYWIKGGLVLAWTELPWTPPEDDEEEALYRLVLDCWERARHHDPSAAPPDDAFREVQSLLSGQPSSASGVGFRKLTVHRPLQGDWTVDLPGYFREHEDDDDDATIYIHDTRVVRGTSLVVTGKGGEGDLGIRHVRQSATEHPGRESGFSFQLDDLEGWGFEERSEGDEYWCFHAQVASGNQICILTLTYDNPDADRDWAVEVFESTRLTEYSDED